MDQPIMLPIDKIKRCIVEKQSFVLQGGAGSGKTETLKRTVQFVAKNHPEKKILCITHTNKAVDEIISRVGSEHKISTIHSFLSSLIKPYKRNLLKLLPELFHVPKFERLHLEQYSDEKAQNSEEHKRYKKTHGIFDKRRFTVLGEATEKVIGKREYDKDPEKYNTEINALIDELNHSISDSIEQHRHGDVSYNETPFNSFKSATFGHDGLVTISALFFERYPNIGKIVSDKYDCIFIDEYQDTNESVIQSLLNHIPDNRKVTVGLFGDSEQAIYEDGIGSAVKLINAGRLKLIEKEDNFRCSPQVIKVANKFRSDTLTQEVALKKINGVLESKESREGSAKLIYAIKGPKPEKPEGLQKNSTAKDEHENQLDIYKAENTRKLEALIEHAKKGIGAHMVLKLPNKFVAQDAGFGNLYNLFNDRYSSLSPREKIKEDLDELQFGQLAETSKLFESSKTEKKVFNRLIAHLKRQGFVIRTRDDKKTLHASLSAISNSTKPAYEVILDAIKAKLIPISDARRAYLYRKDSELKRIENEGYFNAFKALREKGCNTKLQMIKYLKENDLPNMSEEIIQDQFEERMDDIRSQEFYEGLFSANISFEEILAFYRYEDDNSNFMTMHKTKGTGIENVIVVLEEYNWTKYDFSSCFKQEDNNPARQALTKKLLYVACSRTIKNLICVRLIDDASEPEMMQEFFDDCQEVSL
jgi:DNA helicase-2/ATP-dependent DNA helicase PcrA